MKTNKRRAKMILTSFFAMLMPLLASAQTRVEIGDIWYNLNLETKQAEVTSGSGDYITIPATVTYEGVNFNVTSIKEEAFMYYYLESISIPESVTSIGKDAFLACI